MLNDTPGDTSSGTYSNFEAVQNLPPSTATKRPDESSVGSDSYYQQHHHDNAHHSYYDASSSVTGHASPAHHHLSSNVDATDIVHEMHLALLYLLSNPDEFKKALHTHPPQGATTLSEWNADYGEDDDDDVESVITAMTAANNNNQYSSTTPLPFVVFADDAEVVLPQAHTASQLFGIEQVEGIELEAAAGIPALSQLFLRWLALMPAGDHLNIIDPPGLTVMRIAGGRYRVTAAHRVVWTWMNEFASLVPADEWSVDVDGSPTSSSGSKTRETPKLQVGDLVSLTIVDVFETDNQGKLLSYCPTFDNRAVLKTNLTAENIRKTSGKFFSMLGTARNAVVKSKVNRTATQQIKKMGIMETAKNVADNVKHRVGDAVQQYGTPSKGPRPHSEETIAEEGENESQAALSRQQPMNLDTNKFQPDTNGQSAFNAAGSSKYEGNTATNETSEI